jgi:hypothetical protein
MDEFVQTLSKEQKEALIKALGGNTEVESRWQHEEPLSEAVDNITEDFRVVKDNNLQSDSRRESVKAKTNTWEDTGEHKGITTPEASKTPRTRKAPKKKKVKCHACGKTTEVNAGLVFGEYYRCEKCVGVR